VTQRKAPAHAPLAWLARAAVALLVAGIALPTFAHKSTKEARLPLIGQAADFTLTGHDGKPVSLAQLRGKTVALTFLYTTCTDTCPMLTAKLVAIQRQLKPAEASRAFFVAVTVDPERDTVEVLKRYAVAHSADNGGWAFLTGTPAQIAQVARSYGVYYKKQPKGDVDHTFLTSIIDGSGALRVQYLGVRFDPQEFLGDLRSVLGESGAR
jgi:protein SCO1/2